MRGRRRLHRATWTSTELLLTFPPPALASVALVPLNTEDTAGRFRVWLTLEGAAQPTLVWDRKVEGRFPEMKELVSARDVGRCCVGLRMAARVETAYPGPDRAWKVVGSFG
jgi:predicted Rdx family selenoprotein